MENKKIKLIKSTFYNEQKTKRRLCDFIENADILSMNTECKKFESSFSKKQGRKFSVYVANGSCANLLLIQALINLNRLKKGDKVFVSSLTWPTNVMPLLQLGLVPVFLDVELENLNVSSRILKKAFKKNNDVKAFFLTNALGFCADIDEIKEFCKEKQIILLEDNCESLGTEYKNKKLGNYSYASTFSFFVGHHLSTVEGGMICTDNKELYENLKLARSHGWTRHNSQDFKESMKAKYNVDKFYNIYTFYHMAYNFRPTEINGFIGNEQINYWDEIVKKREANFKKFNECIEVNNDIISLDLAGINLISNFGVPLIFKSKKLFEKYKEKFISNNVEIRPIISGNIVNQPFLIDEYFLKDDIVNADYISSYGFYFGNNPEMNKNEINTLMSLLKNK